jgi:REP element-mobilizing transposase RayT
VAGRRPPRLHPTAYLGLRRYFLTFCAAGRRPHFRSPSVVDRVLCQIRLTGMEHHMAILAYCFMPDHLHLVVEAMEVSADLRQFAKLLKQRSGFEYKRLTGASLWETGYYDRVLRNEESTEAVVRYVWNNPVRKGLVPCASDWPFSGSDVFDITEM